MFSFLGQSRAPASVHDFLDSHTREVQLIIFNFKTYYYSFISFAKTKLTTLPKQGNYTSRHSTTRNSTEAAVIYLRRLTMNQIADIESIAQGVMEPLGFLAISGVFFLFLFLHFFFLVFTCYIFDFWFSVFIFDFLSYSVSLSCY